MVDAFVVIVHRNSEYLLGVILTDNSLVKVLVDLKNKKLNKMKTKKK